MCSIKNNLNVFLFRTQKIIKTPKKVIQSSILETVLVDVFSYKNDWKKNLFDFPFSNGRQITNNVPRFQIQ